MVNIIMMFKIYVTFFAFWLLLTLNLELWSIITGLIISSAITKISYGVLYDRNGFRFRTVGIITIIKYFINLLFEIYKSSFNYLVRIIKKDCEPCIVDVVLDVTDPLLISIISNSITLTPGTITVDAEGNKLKVLTLKNCNSCEDCQVIVQKDIKDKFESFFIKKG